jgi:hypothetical protein
LAGFLAVKFIWDVMCLTAPKLKLLLDQLRFGTCFENAFGRVNYFKEKPCFNYGKSYFLHLEVWKFAFLLLTSAVPDLQFSFARLAFMEPSAWAFNLLWNRNGRVSHHFIRW